MAVNTINNKNNFMRQILKTSFASIVVYVGLTTCSKMGTLDYALQKLDKNLNCDKRIEMMNEVEDSTGIDAENNENIVILHAVLENDKLENWEKNILYTFDEMIKDNPYISIRESYKALENIDIKYTDRPNNYKDTVYGVYSPEENTVFIFQSEDEVNKDILRHELIHSILNNRRSSTLPEYFIEGVTELLANEYFSDRPFVELKTYPYEVAMTELLCDMVGGDKVLEAYTKGDMNIITLELSKKLGIGESIKLMKNIKTVFDSFEKNEQIDLNTFNQMIAKINTYLTDEYAKTEDSFIPEKFFYLKGLLENMKEPDKYEKYWSYIEENGVFVKPYFSSRLKEDNPDIRRINIDGTEHPRDENSYSYVLK